MSEPRTPRFLSDEEMAAELAAAFQRASEWLTTNSRPTGRHAEGPAGQNGSKSVTGEDETA